MCLLHDWEGNTGEYSVRGWQYCPSLQSGQYCHPQTEYSPVLSDPILNRRFTNLVGKKIGRGGEKEKEKERSKRKKEAE